MIYPVMFLFIISQIIIDIDPVKCIISILLKLDIDIMCEHNLIVDNEYKPVSIKEDNAMLTYTDNIGRVNILATGVSINILSSYTKVIEIKENNEVIGYSLTIMKNKKRASL